jgi:hypothetical protein
MRSDIVPLQSSQPLKLGNLDPFNCIRTPGACGVRGGEITSRWALPAMGNESAVRLSLVGRRYDHPSERSIAVTNMGIWFLVSAAIVSVGVISWVCFLEVTYQLDHRHSRRHVAATTFSRSQTVTRAREILLQPRKPATRFREQIRSACVEAEVKWTVPMRILSPSNIRHFAQIAQSRVPTRTRI